MCITKKQSSVNTQYFNRKLKKGPLPHCKTKAKPYGNNQLGPAVRLFHTQKAMTKLSLLSHALVSYHSICNS
jgi:hypothetical protein